MNVGRNQGEETPKKENLYGKNKMNTTEKLLYNNQLLLVVIIYLLLAILSCIILFKLNTVLSYVFLSVIGICIWYQVDKLKLIEVKGGKT